MSIVLFHLEPLRHSSLLHFPVPPSLLLCLSFLPPFHCNSSTLTLTPSYSLQSPSSYFFFLPPSSPRTPSLNPFFLISLFNFLSYPSTSLNCTVSSQQCTTDQSSSLVPLPPFPAPLPPRPILPSSPHSCPSRPFLSACLHVSLSFLPPTQVILGPGPDLHWVGGVSLLIVTVIKISEAGSWDTEHLCHLPVFSSFGQTCAELCYDTGFQITVWHWSNLYHCTVCCCKASSCQLSSGLAEGVGHDWAFVRCRFVQY